MLASNQLTGEIPSELGNLANLEFLILADNRLTGSVPEELAELSQLVDGNGVDLPFNHLYTDNNALRGFLNSKQFGGDWERFLFVTELGWDTPLDFSDFIGTLQVTSCEPVTATVVQTRADELVTMPVAGLQPPQAQPAGAYSRGAAGAVEHHYYFAQFADGLGLLSSQILLLNLSQDAMATADITLKRKRRQSPDSGSK